MDIIAHHVFILYYVKVFEYGFRHNCTLILASCKYIVFDEMGACGNCCNLLSIGGNKQYCNYGSLL